MHIVNMYESITIINTSIALAVFQVPQDAISGRHIGKWNEIVSLCMSLSDIKCVPNDLQCMQSYILVYNRNGMDNAIWNIAKWAFAK